MNDVLWMIKFNKRNSRSPQYYFIVLVIIILQQILGTLTGYAFASAWRHIETNALCIPFIKTYTDI